MSTSRLEAFSDGVLAIAATLLALNIQVPPARPGTTLADQLGAQWPSYVAYATSFLTIGIIWVNHHAMIHRLRRIDHTTMVLNLALLISIGLLPFTTALLAAYLKEGQGQGLAAAIYGGSLLLMSIAFAITNRHTLRRRAHLLEVDLDDDQRRRILILGVSGCVPYLLATALAPFSPYVTLAICAAVAGFYATPIASGSRRSS
jgi:uncharacterized membrane protein